MWRFRKEPQHLPKATGPFQPGCMDVMLEYSREGIFLRLYYPTDQEKDNPESMSRWCPWIPDDSYIVGIAKVLMSFTFFVRLAFWWSANTRIPAVWGAKPKTDKKLKPVFFSHGFGGHRFLNSTVCCELASRGFLVAALEHRDHSASNTFYYKSQEDANNKVRTVISHKNIELGKGNFDKRNEQVHYRAKECAKALDFLRELNNGIVPHNVILDVPSKRDIEFDLGDLVGNLDMNNCSMAGHSFGGATALLALNNCPELKQGILLDPWMFPVKNEELDIKLKQPLIFVNTQTFHIASNVNAMEKLLNNGEKRIMYTILSQQLKSPASLWCEYSMVKATIKCQENINISKFPQLIGFLKNTNKGYIPKKSQILERESILKFLAQAEGEIYLLIKLVTIVGIAGCCRTDEICKMELDDIVYHGKYVLIKIPQSKSDIPRILTIAESPEEEIDYLKIFNMYYEIHKNLGVVVSPCFFMRYQNGKFVNQLIGKHTFSKIPSIIAKFLILPNANLYTGHFFRRSSATLLVNFGGDILVDSTAGVVINSTISGMGPCQYLKRHEAWRSSTVAEAYVADSVRKNIEISNKILYKNCSNHDLAASSGFKMVFTSKSQAQTLSSSSALRNFQKSEFRNDVVQEATFEGVIKNLKSN